MAKLDSAVFTSLISPFIEQATCLTCCKLYIAPETASCGHTSCHTCWRKCKSCVSCAAPLKRSSLKLNEPIQIITEHVHNMCDLFEEIFDYRVEEFSIGDGFNQLRSEPDPTNEVSNWLASSQNHFSAPISSESQNDMGAEQVISTVQVHSHTKTITSPQKVVLKQTAQDDWEKIEQLPDTDEIAVKKPKVDVNNEYSTEFPRRSSRKRDLKYDDCVPKNIDVSKDKSSSKNSSIETESKTIKTKQKWNNVKKMRREFSKLNKQNRSKLNVSIEMCKKSKLNPSKSNSVDQVTTADQVSDQLADIEDDTPCDNNKNELHKKQKENLQKDTVNKSFNPNKNGNKSHLNASQNDINIEIVKSGTNNKNINNKDKEKDEMCVDPEIINNDKEKPSKMPFYKKGTLHIDTNREVKNDVQTVNYNIDCSDSHNADDIEITIKIGDSVANIFFKRKKNEPPKITVNQEIQTSIGVNTIEHKSQPFEKKIDSNETRSKNGENIATVEDNPTSNLNKIVEPDKVIKSVSKKNTASAETVTAQLEITDSLEKELSKVMEVEEKEASIKQTSKIISNKSQKITQVKKKDIIPNTQPKNDQNAIPVSSQILTDYLNEQDIFDSGSIREQNVHILKNAKNTPSEIFPTMKSVKSKKLKKAEKRDRDMSEDIETTNKKQKIIQDSPIQNDIVEVEKDKEFPQDSEGINYDAIMGQVFANIDAEIHNTQKSKAVLMDSQPVEEPSKTALNQQKTVILAPEEPAENIINIDDSCIENVAAAEGYSENVFSVVEKENDNKVIAEQDQKSKAVEQNKDNYLTPEIFAEEEEKLCTPHVHNEDDDKSVVEDTPQKSVSFTKPKSKSENAQPNLSLNKQKSLNESQVRSIVDVSDSEISSKISKDVTVVDVARKNTETPLTINKFVDEIKHKSTPVARKSLNFDDDDPEQTLCPTTEPAKTTQEKEFMARAFENTPKSPLRKPLVAKNKLEMKQYCLAGSCLTSSELLKVKLLCRQNNWKYMDKYSDELTHLVVGVDDENKSQRSVKYMCALAASKWIVSFRWIESCLIANKVVKEDQFEALDGTGEPGPRRSRLAHRKLFEGITFYCMPPFSVLDQDTLKSMVVAAGGRVSEEVRGARAEAGRPALLLAEPEHTQENKFIYMAVELSIVPVNYEWVLNCLGGYTLSSIHELLLCPSALLPAATATWPSVLLSQEE